MYVNKLTMNGVRGFDGKRKVALDFARPDGSYAGWTVLAGRNGSGKTTLLRAIAIGLIGQRLSMQLEDTLEGWLSENRKQGSIALEISNDPLWDAGYSEETLGTVAMSWRFGSGRSRKVMDEALFEYRLKERNEFRHFIAPELQEHLLLDRVSVSFKADALLGEVLWSGSRIPGWFIAAYGPFRRLTGGDSDFERSPVNSKNPRSSRIPDYADKMFAVRTLFSERDSLSEAVAWLVRLHLQRLEEQQENVNSRGSAELLEAIFELLQDGLLPDHYKVDRVDSQGLWIIHDETGRSTPLRQMSDGYRTVVALVLDIIRRMFAAYPYPDVHRVVYQDGRPTLRHPGVVLIDEVDAHLHVSWQQRIGAWLKLHFPQVQFIVTTHSPYICQAADENGLIRLPGPSEASPPSVVDQDLYRRVVYGTGDDAVISDLFGLDTPYSMEAQDLRKRLLRLERLLISGHASDEDVESLREIKVQLSSSPVTRVDEISVRLLGDSNGGGI
ncbi:AAA family ATPase [Kitasatospora sp. NPDC088346]|uniref:AAA family ATPase n=1 Tax=Kitasatospora sp. NPDC088346 TaxID=3364073 RepID=UPI0038116374